LQHQGMTLLVSSHILAELEAYCTEMLVMRKGQIVEQVGVKNSTINKPFKLLLADAVDNLADLLQSLPDIIVLNIEHNKLALLQIADDSQLQHATLKALLALNLPVCEFAPVTSYLQDTYLQTIRHSS
jgi:ABC-2 type transport system ATP-binding protein